MKQVVVALALVGCQRTEPPPPTVASGSAPPEITTAIVGCAPAAELPGRIGSASPAGWFPYALRGETPGAIASPLAQQANLALTEKLPDLDLCLTGKTGSLSIMLMLDADGGGAIEARVGGIGDRGAEQCVAKIAAALALPRPDKPAEIECVLGAKANGPYRVTRDGGYRVVELTADGVTLDNKPVDLKMPAPALETALVIALPDADGDRLSKVLGWLAAAPAVLVAVTADGGPPVYVAMADRRGDRPGDKQLSVDVVDEQLRACAGAHQGAASLLEPKRVDDVLRAAVAACGGDACPERVEVGVGGKHLAKQLVGATSGVRRAGHDPVLVIGSRCK